MKYFYTITITSMLTCFCCIASMCYDIYMDRKLYKSFVGQPVIINGMPTNIVDFDTYNRTFTLSDGRIISKYYVIK